MGLFDNLKNTVGNAMNSAAQNSQQPSSRSVNIVFPSLPETLEQFKALPQAVMSTPFDTAALTVLAFCFKETLQTLRSFSVPMIIPGVSMRVEKILENASLTLKSPNRIWNKINLT